MRKIVIAMVLVASMLLPGCVPEEAPVNTTSAETSSAAASSETNWRYDPFPNHSDTLEYVRRVIRITGRSSLTNTMDKFNVCGTDLGIPCYDEELGRMMFFFGDTYAGENFSGDWRSNVAFYTDQTDYSEGIVFNGALTREGAAETGSAVQITPGRNTLTPLIQGSWTKTQLTHTCIPTGAVMIDGTMYLFYMEIDKNAFPQPGGTWGVYNNRVMKSTDHGVTWEQVSTMVWPVKDNNDVEGLAPNFGQIFPLKVDDTIYLYGLTGGRFGGTKLARVSASQIEEFEAYEYFTGYDETGEPMWMQGSAGLEYIKALDSSYLIEAPCGEMCVTYNAYLKKYVALYQDQLQNILVYRTADTPYGPFSAPETIVQCSGEMIGGYGAFTCEQLSDMGGQRMWIMVSEWDPIYNVSQLEIKFK